MGEILSAFGIDAKLILIQIINFGILLFALWYFLYTPVLRVLQERQEKIQKGIEDAKTAEQSREEAEHRRDEIISEAHHQSENIVKKAEKHAEERKEEIVKAAEQKADSLVSSAEQKALDTQERIKAEAEQEIAQTAVLAAEKILREKRSS